MSKPEKNPTANQIGTTLVELCQKGDNLKAIEELYADNIVSVEAAEAEGFPRTMEGREAIVGKNQWWVENNEVHSAEIKGPFPHGDDRFAVLFNYDVTFKPSGQKMKMEEVGLYEVQNGKIVREEFFYQGM